MTTPRKRRSSADPKPKFGLVWHHDERLKTIDHRIVAACKVASVEMTADANGRPSAKFVLIGDLTRDVDNVVARLEGLRVRGAARKVGGQ